jgi:hypothetical protein
MLIGTDGTSRCYGTICKNIPSNSICSSRVDYRVPLYSVMNSTLILQESETRISQYLSMANNFDSLTNKTQCMNSVQDFVCRSRYPECNTLDDYRLRYTECTNACQSSYWCFEAAASNVSSAVTNPIQSDSKGLLQECIQMCDASINTSNILLLLLISVFFILY